MSDELRDEPVRVAYCHYLEGTSRTNAEAAAEFDRWLASHDALMRAEQREADAVIAETRYFGTGQLAQLHRWGSKQAALAIRAAGTETGETP